MLFKIPIFASQFQISTLIWGYPVHTRVHCCFAVGFILESLATECLRLVMCLNLQSVKVPLDNEISFKVINFVEPLYYWLYFSLGLYPPVICNWGLRTGKSKWNCKALCKVSRAGGVGRKIPNVKFEPPVLMCFIFLVSSILWCSHIWLCDDNGNHL